MVERDKDFVRRAYTDRSETGRALRESVTFRMAEQRLAADDWFWSEALQDFVRVRENAGSH